MRYIILENLNQLIVYNKIYILVSISLIAGQNKISQTC